MFTRPVVIVAVLAAVLAVVLAYDRHSQTGHMAAPAGGELVRPHSPVLGPVDAPVTIVEFFDPACEACRTFYPVVKQILAMFPGNVRLVMRYTPFHQGSDEVVRILEAARIQGQYESVLEALLARQPEWAVHGAPDLALAWDIAGVAGLDLARARADAVTPPVDVVLKQDLADAQAGGVTQTPTFFVHGKPLPSFGARQLLELVKSEVESQRAGPGD
ncbi:MAG: DsbA family protein [Gammaproteobacteria bacterium]|nr:DsbA family protein [Gammaproteobacteria bacterium]